MPQFMRPTSDLIRSVLPIERQQKNSSGTFVLTTMTPAGQKPALSTGASAFGVIDEANRDTSDYFESALDAIGGVVAVETGNPSSTPISNRNHFLRVAVGKNSSGGEDLACTIEIRQGYSDETDANRGTLVAAIRVLVPDSLTTYTRRLTEAEAILITDYTDVQFRFVMRKVGGSGGARRVRVYWAELEVPSLGAPLDKDIKLSQNELRLQQMGESIAGRVEP
ncbi:hypothetical protein LCGC14_0581840 [marine sediment metagenome]|uniref:Uncharacterized protein n=1 Tax=marine sediment metagenome TaxID=412755 RepID=A0A0F9RL84_9ZZZZ